MTKTKTLDSKDNIIKVAFSLFLKKGFKAVTINNIQERTGLSKGAIYHHFKSKEEIYFATLETYSANERRYAVRRQQDCSTHEPYRRSAFPGKPSSPE